jgi:DNA repair photolyase
MAALPKGCTAIYESDGQAGEYAPFSLNLYKGCGHACAYCYVPPVTHQKRDEFDAGAVLRAATTKLPPILDRLRADCERCRDIGFDGQVTMSFLTDPYHPGDNHPTRRAIELLVEHGLAFCTLTKGGSRALRDIDLFRPDRDAFASTLTSLDAVFSAKWERHAAPPAERVATLQAFHDRGIFTWVSLEPTLDVDASLEIVEMTHQWVDLYKVGKANYLKEITRTTDWRSYTLQMIDLLHRLGKQHYVKADLQPFLPAGYANPLRVPQHH